MTALRVLIDSATFAFEVAAHGEPGFQEAVGMVETVVSYLAPIGFAVTEESRALEGRSGRQ
jgi:hypothetical protein